MIGLSSPAVVMQAAQPSAQLTAVAAFNRAKAGEVGREQDRPTLGKHGPLPIHLTGCTRRPGPSSKVPRTSSPPNVTTVATFDRAESGRSKESRTVRPPVGTDRASGIAQPEPSLVVLGTAAVGDAAIRAAFNGAGMNPPTVRLLRLGCAPRHG